MSAELGTKELEAFNVGTAGNFPYYWNDPSKFAFNSKTYNWIDLALKKNVTPIQLGAPFTNIYIDALSSVSYGLSNADQATLNEAAGHVTDQQGAVLSAWHAAYGSFPPGSGEKIDNIAKVITTEWASPATNLNAIKKSLNLGELLNQVPASGEPIVPVFVNWINAWGSTLSLKNAVTMNTGYLTRALEAVQSASKENGGMQLNDGQSTYHPAYQVNPDTAQIINGLKNDSQSVDMSMTVKRSTSDEFKIDIEGGASLSVPVLDFLTVNVGGSSSYFKDSIATTSNETTVSMKYPGVTLVNFGPVPFDQATLQNWCWLKPITDAIANEGKDVTGFKFTPKPNIDFSKGGPFSYLENIVISNYPTITITTKSSSYTKIKETFTQSASVGISFLGIPLGIGGKESTYSSKVRTSSSDQTVTITLSPPPELVASPRIDAIGWILGAVPYYPGAED